MPLLQSPRMDSHSRRPSFSRRSFSTSLRPDTAASNRYGLQPASPEIITSLISSLSAISTPAESLFDSLPAIEPSSASSSRTAPNTPRSNTSSRHSDNYGSDRYSKNEPQSPPDATSSFGVDGAATASHLHPDDAAVAPVVRLAKPSSRASRSQRSSFKDGFSPRSTSRSSRVERPELHDEIASSFGKISTEPGSRLSTASAASVKSASGSSRLLRRSSRSFRDKQKEMAKGSATGDGLSGGGPVLRLSRSISSLRSSRSNAPSVEDLTLGKKTLGGSDTPPASAVSRRASLSSTTSKSDLMNQSPGGIGSGRTIPTRESSLRHSFSGATKKRSPLHSRHSYGSGSRDFRIDQDLLEEKNEEDTVTKRIKELQVKKEQRKVEMVALENPSRTSTAATTRVKSPGPRPKFGLTRASSDTVPQTVTAVVTSSLMDEGAPSPTIAPGKKRLSNPMSATVTPIPTPDKNAIKLQRRRSQGGHAVLEKNLSTTHERMSDERPSSADSLDDAVDTYLSAPRLSMKVTHPQTGRVIAYSDVGDPNGHVVICCVGMGLTRYLTVFYDELARTLKLRLITLDRPGVGESGPCTAETGTPLNWPDDVAVVCNSLKITKFSMLAHSAGAIYALATALRIPQHIRGRIHLLAPWIPPSQMTNLGSQNESLPSTALPYTQRILRTLPTAFLKVANSSFMSATSASITTSLPKSGRKTGAAGREGKRRSMTVGANSQPNIQTKPDDNASSFIPTKPPTLDRSASSQTLSNANAATANQSVPAAPPSPTRLHDYEMRLTHEIWSRATTHANPAIDLLTCLERRRTIGFRYADITRAVVIHHGSRDTRVPVENVKWLGRTMRRCEVRVLEGEGHGLMASAAVMGSVLCEIAGEWEDWMVLVRGRKEGKS